MEITEYDTAVGEGVAGAVAAADVAGPSWADMVPDALAKIFSRLSLKDMLIGVPSVCRSWRRVSQDSACWLSVDLVQWTDSRTAEEFERMLVLLVGRSRGCLQEINVPNLSDKQLQIIACSESPIQVLRIPYSSITDDCMCHVATKFPLITFLDLSGCASISTASIASLGKNCRFITRLNLNMYPLSHGLSSSHSNDEMALTVAQFMPQLKHLEMVYGLITNHGFKVLLEKCTCLEHLDVRGCWYLNVEETYVQEAKKRLRVFHPPVVENDIYNTESDLDDSDLYVDSDECSWYESEDFDMYEEEINGTLYFWPDTSP